MKESLRFFFFIFFVVNVISNLVCMFLDIRSVFMKIRIKVYSVILYFFIDGVIFYMVFMVCFFVCDVVDFFFYFSIGRFISFLF